VSEQHVEREQRVTPLELFFDLVFVFGFTQVTMIIWWREARARTRALREPAPLPETRRHAAPSLTN
jgi:hypothetical protein